jgi:hypothetical protein
VAEFSPVTIIFSPATLGFAIQKTSVLQQQDNTMTWILAFILVVFLVLMFLMWLWLDRTFERNDSFQEHAITITATRDDLKLIEGIGPKISSLLDEAGISTFAALAESDAGLLNEILKNANTSLANPETWPEQAHLAATGA